MKLHRNIAEQIVFHLIISKTLAAWSLQYEVTSVSLTNPSDTSDCSVYDSFTSIGCAIYCTSHHWCTSFIFTPCDGTEPTPCRCMACYGQPLNSPDSSGQYILGETKMHWSGAAKRLQDKQESCVSVIPWSDVSVSCIQTTGGIDTTPVTPFDAGAFRISGISQTGNEQKYEAELVCPDHLSPRGITYCYASEGTWYDQEKVACMTEELEECLQQTVLDLAFLLDASGSITIDGFTQLKEFTAYLVTQYDVGPSNVQVAAASFDQAVYSQFSLTAYTSTVAVVDAFRNIVYTGGSTGTDKALEFARTNIFASGNGHRTGFPKVLVLATDGYSDNKTATIQQGDILRNAGYTVLVLGIGSNLDFEELEAVATQPSFVYIVDSTEALEAFLPSFMTILCTETRAR